MLRSLLLCAAVAATCPTIALGQSRGALQTNVPCCGQVESKAESPDEMILTTQQNLQALLMMTMNTNRLAAGDYFVTESAEGFEFRAQVSRKGIVESWYFLDTDGTTVARIKAGGSGGTPGGGTTSVHCLIKYSRDVSGCAYLEHSWPNRYTLCLENAWSQLISCLQRASGGSTGTVIR